MSSSTSDLLHLFEVEKAVLKALKAIDNDALPENIKGLVNGYLEQVDFE